MKQLILDNLCFDHYLPYDQILLKQEQNFHNHLQRLTPEEKQIWFQGVNVQSISDVKKLPVRSSSDIIKMQITNPPYGMWSKGEILFTSSGSSNSIRKVVPRSLENYYRYMMGVARGLENHGVNQTDAILTTDSGDMFAGHTVIEDAATHFLGASRVRCSSPLLKDKLTSMEYYRVTVLSGTPGKLIRLAKLMPKNILSHPLKMVISLGGTLENKEEIADAFGINQVVDYYGSSEMGNIGWTCAHGHFHVNIDMCHISQGKYFTNLTNLPIFNYAQGEELNFSFKGTCECGSNLPTVDQFTVSNFNKLEKD
jgi:phenylacetate-coenzyme A ligase PaaK-like adenylate-forming protein